MVKLHWRQGAWFLLALACATGVLVAAGLSEDAQLPQSATSHAGATLADPHARAAHAGSA